MHELMERVEEYKRLEDDQLQGKSKSKVPQSKAPSITTIKGTKIALGSCCSAIAS